MKILLVALLAIGTIVSAKHIVQEKQYFNRPAPTTTRATTTTTTTRATTTTKPSTTTTTTTTKKPEEHEPVQQSSGSTDICEKAQTLTADGLTLDSLLRAPFDLPADLEMYRGIVDMLAGPGFLPYTIPADIIEMIFWKKSSTCPDSIVPSELGQLLEQFVPSYCENFWTPVTHTDMTDDFEAALVQAYTELSENPQGAIMEITNLAYATYGPQIEQMINEIDAQMHLLIEPILPMIPIVQPTLMEMMKKLTEEKMGEILAQVLAGSIDFNDPISFANLCFTKELVNQLMADVMMAGMMGMGK